MAKDKEKTVSQADQEAEIEAAAIQNADPEVEEVKQKIKELRFTAHFSDTYTFEGQEFKELDLSPIRNLTTLDLIHIDKVYAGMHRQVPSSRYTDTQYVVLLAMRALNKPIEFFNQMSAKDFSEVMGVVALYFLF